jgi:hypothetical protein
MKGDIGEWSYSLVGFEVLTAVSKKMAVIWVVAPCSLVEVYQILKFRNIFNRRRNITHAYSRCAQSQCCSLMFPIHTTISSSELRLCLEGRTFSLYWGEGN